MATKVCRQGEIFVFPRAIASIILIAMKKPIASINLITMKNGWLRFQHTIIAILILWLDVSTTSLPYNNNNNNKTLFAVSSGDYYQLVAKVIRTTTQASVHLKGGSPFASSSSSSEYEERRQVHNGLCNNMFPDLIVVPQSTQDVSTIVKISRRFQVPISVRSGGHSYVCQSIKSGTTTYATYLYHLTMPLFV